MEGVYTNAEMERILAGSLGNVLVGANTGGFQGLRGQLLILIGDKVAAEGEVVNRGALAAEIVYAYLGASERAVSASLSTISKQVTTVPSGLGHRGYTSTWGTACSCSSGSSGLVGVPFLQNINDGEFKGEMMSE